MDDFRVAREVIQASRRMVVLTGAGISAASGVPINSVNHSRTSFLTTVTTETFVRTPMRVWELHIGLRDELAWCLPNAAHVALAQYAHRRPHVVLTQNIDGLHEESGHPNVCALHGTIWRNRCTSCDATRSSRRDGFEPAPTCPSCGALERPDITWIGDKLQRAVLSFAFSALRLCDAFLVVGTSAHVAPVSSFADIMQQAGRPVIEINPRPSGLVASDVCLRLAAEEALPLLLRE